MRLTYLNAKAVKSKINGAGKQLTKEGLKAIDLKVEQYLTKLITQFNGHHKRIDEMQIFATKL